MTSSISFTLQVTLGYGSGKESEEALNKACSRSSLSSLSLFGPSSPAASFFGSSAANSHPSSVFVASASAVQLSADPRQGVSIFSQPQQSPFAAIFVPPSIVESCREKATANSKVHASGSCFWLKEPRSSKLAADLFPRIHPIFASCKIFGIIVTSIAAEQNAPAEMVLVDLLSSTGGPSLADMMEATNGQSIVDGVDNIIKILPISNVSFSIAAPLVKGGSAVGASIPKTSYLSTCPVCLHRIDPVRLGLPRPSNQHLCSKFCPAPSLVGGAWVAESRDACAKQRLLHRWPPPSRCTACDVIEHYWKGLKSHDEGNDLFCAKCAMHQTLWVCLTCGFVGCGRYSNKHSVEHFQETGHPYSLELATLRIWAYDDVEHGGYAHRVDLLDCPSSPPLAYPWMTVSRAERPAASSRQNVFSKSDSFDSFNASMVGTEKSPKKATMIGEEYETLLQSALEEQAQHYEGEISRLRADLTAALVDENTMTIEEQREVEELKLDIAKLRKEIEQAGRELLDAQAQEAGHRATSQRLLGEQQVANDLLVKVQDEAKREQEGGKMQVEDLEQQVSDLTANLKMRQQFSESEELSQAQIFGTKSSESKTAKKGKKKGRFFRK
jgi:BRCA1-associated protein